VIGLPVFARGCTLFDYLAASLLLPIPPTHPPSAMATPATPQTPSAQTPQLRTPNGTWKHPKFDEITRRQYATTFDERNVRAIVANAGLLFISICANTVASKVKLLGYAV
jgi:nucleoporin POM34